MGGVTNAGGVDAVVDQVALTEPLTVAAAARSRVRIAECDADVGAEVMAGGWPADRRRVAITVEASVGEPVTLVAPVTVLWDLVAAASPFLAPPSGACARTTGHTSRP